MSITLILCQCFHNTFRCALIGLLLVGLAAPSCLFSQTLKTITGTVNDSAQGVLQGVNVKVKGTNRGAASDAGGKYSITATNNDVLIFSYAGMQTQEINVAAKQVIDVVMAATSSNLGEVVVIGYGTVRKPDLTGAVSQVKAAEMEQAPVASFAEALAGRVAGISVSGNDGQPGGGVNIVIRGPGSLTQSTSPLYVIDGFPVEDPDPATLNPEDIETFNILKDASSTAIYGSRAANGVIVIQTKRGRTGRPVVSLSSSYGFTAGRKKMELMSPYEFVKYQQEAFPTEPSTLLYLKSPLDSFARITGTDYQDHVFTNGAVQKHNISLRGGNDQTRYSISGSFFDQEGIIINTGISRYTGRITLDQTISNKLKLGVTTNYSRVKEFGQVVNATPNTSVSSYTMFRTWGYRPIGYPGQTQELLEQDIDAGAIGNFDFRINPVVDLENQHLFGYTTLLEGNAFLDYQIHKNLSLKINGGVRSNNLRDDAFYNSKTTNGSRFNPSNLNGVNGSVRYTNRTDWSNENTLNYSNTFNQNHTVKGLALLSFGGGKLLSHGYSSRLLPNESLGMDGLDEGITFNPVAGASEYSRVSYGTRWDYNYKSKYIITGTFRADASSKFKEHWGYFPGGAIAWNIHKENFFANAFPVVSNSKLRFSYGIVGNDRIGDFDWYTRLRQDINGYSFNNTVPINSVYIQSLANSELSWEKTTSMDLGYELGLFNNRVELIIDLYRKTTKDLLLEAALPPTTGFGFATKNIGKLSNEGIELTLNTINIKSGSFRWESSFNISFNRNKVLALNDGQNELLTNVFFESQFNTPLYIAEIGKPSGQMFGFIWDGNYQFEDFDKSPAGLYTLKNTVPTNGTARNSIRPGDIKYKDLDGNGVVNVFDKRVIGRGQPVHTGGLMNNFSYKNFHLGVFLQWSYGNDIYNANRLTFEGNSNRRFNLNQFASYVNRWTPENPTNENYRAGGQGPIGFHSSRVVEDGSYLRLKTLSLGYDLPKSIIQKAKLTGLSLNIAAQNLITITNYSGMDPEVSVRNATLAPGFDYSAYPQSRTIVFGLKATF